MQASTEGGLISRGLYSLTPFLHILHSGYLPCVYSICQNDPSFGAAFVGLPLALHSFHRPTDKRNTLKFPLFRYLAQGGGLAAKVPHPAMTNAPNAGYF